MLWSHRGGFVPIFKRDGSLHSEQFNYSNQLNNDGSVLGGHIAGLHLCVLWRTLTLLEWFCEEAPANQQGRLQHN
jgi:hypothetical protein